MTKKPKIVIDLNDKIQLDLFGGEDIPVSDEIKEAIDVFKNPPDHSLDNSSVSEKGPPEHFISRSRILKHRAGLISDLGVALELRVADGEGIIDDGHNPGELDTWVGYLRADKRMDDDFYKLIWAAGGKSFNYGFESGSQKVLNAINKKNTIEDIEANIISGEKHNVNTVALWIIGSPEEDHEAYAHSFNMLWNHRRRIHSISPGTGLWDIPGTAYDDREKFNLE